MLNSKWFPGLTLKEVIFEMSFRFLPEGTIIFPGYYNDIFKEMVLESKKLSEEEHANNLRLLALSEIEEIVQLATDTLHEMGLLTADEQWNAVIHFCDVEAPAMFAEIEAMTAE